MRKTCLATELRQVRFGHIPEDLTGDWLGFDIRENAMYTMRLARKAKLMNVNLGEARDFTGMRS